MRKILTILSVAFCIASLTACSAEFNGSSTGNDTQFIMEYSILNTSDSRNMTLKAGDIIHTSIVSNSGSVSIEIETSAGEVIYSDEDIPTSDFEIVIPQDDTYTFTVTGSRASGFPHLRPRMGQRMTGMPEKAAKPIAPFSPPLN